MNLFSLTRADFGYGNAFNGDHNFPFFKNFYAGGIDSVRGYRGYTLGPRDSNYKSIGGNMLADASIGLNFSKLYFQIACVLLFLSMLVMYTALLIIGFLAVIVRMQEHIFAIQWVLKRIG